jgi:hypothetical protein
VTALEKKDLGLGIGAILLGAVTWLYFRTLPGSAGSYPKMISVITVLLGIVIALRAVKALRTAPGSPEQFSSGEDTSDKKPSYRSVALIVLYLIIYYFLFQKFSYTISTFLLMVATSLTLGYRNFKVLLPTALLVSIGLYLSFTQLFHVRFMGIFF